MPGPGRKARDRGDVENAAAMPREAVDESERQLGERPHVEIDHRELVVAVELGRCAGETKTRIVDDVVWLDAVRRERRGDAAPPHRAARDRAAAPVGRGRPAAAISSASASSRSSRRATSTSSCPCSAKTRASSAPMPDEAPVIERHRPHGSARRHRRLSRQCAGAASMRSRGDTPSRSAARHNRLSSSSSRWPSA